MWHWLKGGMHQPFFDKNSNDGIAMIDIKNMEVGYEIRDKIFW